jgi:hypothetical protein
MQGAAAYFRQILIFILLFSAALFLPAGRFNWPAGWLYVAILAGSQLVIGLILWRLNPELLGQRADPEGERDLDPILAGIMALFDPL